MGSIFRFLSSGRRGNYSVWRGEAWLGHITKNVHHYQGRAFEAGWIPTLPSGRELATEATRDAAAAMLWNTRAP